MCLWRQIDTAAQGEAATETGAAAGKANGIVVKQVVDVHDEFPAFALETRTEIEFEE